MFGWSERRVRLSGQGSVGALRLFSVTPTFVPLAARQVPAALITTYLITPRIHIYSEARP
jgi:hypothetical protein